MTTLYHLQRKKLRPRLCVLTQGETSCMMRARCEYFLFGVEGHEHGLLNIEVNELRRTYRITRRMHQDELTTMEQHARVASFYQTETIDDLLQMQSVSQSVGQSVSRSVGRSVSQSVSNIEFGNETITTSQRINRSAQRTRHPPSSWQRSSRRTSVAQSPNGAQATYTSLKMLKSVSFAPHHME